MKKLLFLLIAVTNTLYAQRMYRESTDNCKINNLWYRVNDVCDAQGESSLRCDYCGLYYWSVTEKNTHQKTCKYRPHIEYDYDEAGNRTERRTFNYHWGRKVVAYNNDNTSSNKVKNKSLLFDSIIVVLRKKESEYESLCQTIV